MPGHRPRPRPWPLFPDEFRTFAERLAGAELEPIVREVAIDESTNYVFRAGDPADAL